MKKLTIVGLVVFAAASISVAALFGSASARRDEEERVTVSASLAKSNQCPDDAPVAVTVHNGSASVVKRVDMTINLFERGDSSAAGTVLEGWTTIVESGATETRCFQPHFFRRWSAPLTVIAKRDRVDFYEKGAQIPR